MKEIVLNSEVEFPEEEWADISQNAKDFILALLRKDPSTRLTAIEALNHPFIKGTQPDSLRSSLVDDSIPSTPTSTLSFIMYTTRIFFHFDFVFHSFPLTKTTGAKDGMSQSQTDTDSSEIPQLHLSGIAQGEITSPVTTPNVSSPHSERSKTQQQRAQNFKKFAAKRRFAVRIVTIGAFS